MKLKNLIIVITALAFLGNGCIRPIDTNKKTTEQTASREESFNKLNFYQESYSKEDREKWRSLGWPEACEREFQEFGMTDDGGLRVYPLENERYILSVTCNTYAYQSSLIFMLLHVNPQEGGVTGTTQTLDYFNPITKKLAPIQDEETGAPVVLGFDHFDVKTKTLTIFTKSRGVGDCGSRGTYQVIDNKITLVKYEAQSCEDADKKALENPNGELTDWPVIYERK